MSTALADLSTAATVPGLRPSRRLRVLTLTPFFPSAENTAAGGFIADPLRFTQRFGIENSVIAVSPFFRRRQTAPGRERWSSWRRYFALPGNLGLPTAGNFLASQLRNTIAAMHASQAFDLIHAHAALPCGHAASLLGQELNIPFVVTVHGLDVFSSRQGGRILGGWCARVSGQVYRKARAVICISEKVRENVTASLPVPCRVVYNGVDASEFAPTEETASPVTVLSVGNLIPVKGHDLLLRAFARVTSQFDDCRLVIIGEGPERRKLDQLAHRLRISERVRFLGRQSRGEVAAAMANCAAFVLPSSYEGLGCVYLEAMACGKPVIGCHGQGIAEIIRDGKNGLLVTPGDELELADALRTLLRDPHLRRTLGTAARQTVLDGYTLEHQARELVDLYRECVR